MSMINAKFMKVSFEQFKKDYMKYVLHTDQDLSTEFEDILRETYDGIKIPCRATKRSSGYDFFAPYNIQCMYNKASAVPTGIRIVFNEEDYDLSIYPRSGLGCKHRIELANTVGIIDNDYYESDNEGHIIIHLVMMNDDNNTIFIPKGKAFCQGIIRPFCRIAGDEGYDLATRNGGHGSTDK